MFSAAIARRRFRSPAISVALAAVGLLLARTASGVDTAPAPRLTRAAAKTPPPADLDRMLMSEVKANSMLMKNLEHLSDVIGPRLTGSKGLEKANEWAAAKMKEYGLENVRLEPWEIPLGWERGSAHLTVVEPGTKVRCPVAAVGWSPGTQGTVTGDVVILRASSKADLDKYKGKLKNAVIITSAPAVVAALKSGVG